MKKLKATMYDEIDAIMDKEYLTTADLDLIYKIVDIIKDICEIESCGGTETSQISGLTNEGDLMVRVKRMIDESTK